MKVTSVGILAALGMILTSYSVWSLTPSKGSLVHTGGDPDRPSTPLAPADTPSFSRDGTLKLEGRLGHAWLPADEPGSTYLLATVGAPSRPAVEASPVNLAIVLDRSGSMAGKRLSNALDAARGMVRRLRDGDMVTVVTYASSATTLVPATRIDSESRDRVTQALSTITAQGDTCISCGLGEAMAALERTGGSAERILLLSDGQPTTGLKDIQDFRDVGARARRMGCPISSIGVDVDYNEQLLSALALESNGRHYFADNDSELQKAFDGELSSLVRTVATSADVELELAPGVEVERVFDRAFDRRGNRIVVPLGSFSADEQKTVLVKLRVPAARQGSLELAKVALSFEAGAGRQKQEISGTLAARLSSGEPAPAPLDPLVEARLGRTETANTLEEANALFNSGDLAGARQRLRAKSADLQSRKSAAARAPGPVSDSIRRDFDRQSGELDKAEKALGDAPASATPGESPQQSRAGKAGTKRSTEAANPLRR
jgi:Ca-activated chloride channel homolog